MHRFELHRLFTLQQLLDSLLVDRRVIRRAVVMQVVMQHLFCRVAVNTLAGLVQVGQATLGIHGPHHVVRGLHQVTVATHHVTQLLFHGLALRDIGDQAGIHALAADLHCADPYRQLQGVALAVVTGDLVFRVGGAQLAACIQQGRQQQFQRAFANLCGQITKQLFCGRVEGVHHAFLVDDNDALGSRFNDGAHVRFLFTQASKQLAERLCHETDFIG